MTGGLLKGALCTHSKQWQRWHKGAGGSSGQRQTRHGSVLLQLQFLTVRSILGSTFSLPSKSPQHVLILNKC